MPVTLAQDTGNVLTVNLSGQFRKADLERIQAAAEAAIARHGKINSLVLADGFLGWEPRQDWGDLGFMMAHDRDIGKIAVVGSESWRDDVLMFLGAGIRAAEVRYFGPDDIAIARFWLGEDGSQG